MYQAQRYFRTLELEKVLAKLAEQATATTANRWRWGLPLRTTTTPFGL